MRTIAKILLAALIALASAFVTMHLIADMSSARAEGETAVSRRRPIVGAYRWDAWYRGSPYVKLLAAEEWHYRHPFFAKILPDGQVEVFGDKQAVMDREIKYAAAGGIDFWVFNMYVVRDPDGNPIEDPATGWRAEDMNLSRKFYLSSRYKSRVKFSLMLSMPGSGSYCWGIHNWELMVQEAIAQMKEPSYQKVMGRPLVFFWLAGEDPEKILGSWQRLRHMLGDFRRRVMRTGMKNPYVTALVWSAEEGMRAVSDLGMNAVTAYVSPGIRGWENPDTYTYLGYEELAQADTTLWNSFRDAGLQAIPTLSTGWDPRPHRDDEWGYGGYKSGPVVDQATPEQLAAHLEETLQWIRTYPASAPSNAVVIYAWNEVSEGGWVIPTHAEGTARLDALRSVRR